MVYDKWFIAVFAVIVGVFAGCDKKDPAQVANNLTEQPNMNGTFRSACAGSDIVGLSVREKLVFEGNKFTREQNFYETEDCSEKEAGGSIILEGNFVLDADGLPQSEGGSLQLDLQKAFIAPGANFFVTALNTLGLCGRDDYAVGVKTEVTNGSDDLSCPVKKVPQTVFGAYRLDDRKLYLNEGGLGEMSETKDKTPTKLDTTRVYTRE